MKKHLNLILSTFVFVCIAGCSGSDKQAGSLNKKVYSGVSGTSIQVSTGLNNEEQPAIAYDREGRYLAVWSDYRNSSATPVKASDIYGKICDGSNATAGLNAIPPVCGTDFLIASGDGNQWQPKVAYDYNSKKYLVAFADTAAGYSIIKGQLISQAEANAGTGVFAATSFDISEHLAIAEPSQIEPEVVYNDVKKTFTVAWMGTSNFDSTDYPERASDFSLVTNTATFSPTWSIGDTTTLFAGAVAPNLAVAANKILGITSSGGVPITNYTVTPSVSDQNTTQVTVRLNSNSNIIGQPGDLTITYLDSGSPTNSFQNGPVNSAPPPATAFTANYSSSIANAAYAYFFLDSFHVVPAHTISQSVSGSNIAYAVLTGSNLIGQPTMYYRSFPSQTITWPARTWRAGSVIVIPYVFSGTPSLATTQIIETAAGNRNATSDFTIAMSGVTLTATLKSTSALIGTTNSVDFTYTPIKNLFGPVVGTKCPNSYGPIPYLPINLAGTSLISYRDYSFNTGLGTWALGIITPYSEIVNVDGVTDSGSAIVTKWSTSGSESKPRLAFNPLDGETFIAWSGTQYVTTLTIPYALDNGVCNYSHVFTAAVPGNSRIILRRFINNLATDYLLGISATYPSLSIDPASKRLLVAWEEQGNASTGKDVSAQLFDLTNLMLYGNLISVTNATGDQSSPASAYDMVNQRHLIVWEDARNQSANLSNIDIYGQFVDPQGNLSGGNVPINVDEGNQLSPAVSFGDVNFRQFLLLWKDARVAGNSDIYGQLMKYSVLPQLVITDVNDNPILNGAMDFGNVAVGQTLDKHIKLRNDGNATLTIDSMTSPTTPFSFLTPAPVSINPGNSYDMTVHFAPTAAGNYAGNPSNTFKTDILSNGGNTTLYFSGTGDGINPLIITTPSIPDTIPTVSIDTVLSVISATGGVYPYTWNITLPTGLTLGTNVTFNTATGEFKQLAGSTIPTGTYLISLSVTDSNNPKVTSDIKKLTLNVSNIAINTTTVLSTWTLGANYAGSPIHSLTSTGGVGSVTWMLIAGGGNLPAGIVLNVDGTFSGTALATGQYSFSVSASDSAQTASAPFSITINPTPSISTASLPSATVGVSYSQTLSVSGGTAPIIWSVTGGLPNGLFFDTGKGVISGTPLTSGTFNLAFSAQDAAGISDAKTLSLTVTGGGGTNTGGAPGGVVTASGGGKSGCFIATAAYGSYLDPHVMVLRHFRDDVLLQSEIGTAFVSFYYTYSPPIADFIAQHDLLRMIMRFALTPLIFAVKYPLLAALMIPFAGVFIFRRRFSMKVQPEMTQTAE